MLLPFGVREHRSRFGCAALQVTRSVTAGARERKRRQGRRTPKLRLRMLEFEPKWNKFIPDSIELRDKRFSLIHSVCPGRAWAWKEPRSPFRGRLGEPPLPFRGMTDTRFIVEV